MQRPRIILLALLLTAPGLVRADAPIFWTFPYTRTSERVYTAYNVLIAGIEERGGDAPITYTGVPAATVTMRGPAYEGEITIVEPGRCWWIEMTSDLPEVRYRWESSVPCRRVFLPLIGAPTPDPRRSN